MLKFFPGLIPRRRRSQTNSNVMSSAQHMHREAPTPSNAGPCTPEQDTNSNLYGMLENALRNQMEVLRSNRLEGVVGRSPRAAEDDDGLDNELSHLEEAERAMRDELAAAVMDFGLSLPKSPTAAAGTDVDVIADVPGEGTDNNNNCSGETDQKPPSQQFVLPESQHKRQQQQPHLSDGNCYNGSTATGSPEKILNVSLDDTSARSQADMIDERELYAALTDLCQWIREGDSLQLQIQQSRAEKRQNTSTSSPYRRRQQQHSPVRGGGAMRRSVVSPQRYNGTPSDAQRRSTTIRQRRPPNLRELEKNLPVDELCRWLKEGATPKCANTSTVPSGQRGRTRGNCNSNQMETETPYTFHVPSVTGTSSLLVLGSNTVRPPQGKSPLRKTHC